MVELTDYAKELSDALRQFDKTVFLGIYTFNINCNDLPEYGNEVREDKLFEPIFSILTGLNTKPVLYWYKIKSGNTRDIYRTLVNYQTNPLNRTSPVIKKGFDKWETETLYVGKCKSNISGRTFVHMGYYSNQETQGLQLCHWTKELNLLLELNIIPLPLSLVDLAGLFEVRLANILIPLFGKHK